MSTRLVYFPFESRLTHSFPRKREPSVLKCLGTNSAAVVPAQAGTHNHQAFGYRRDCHIALLRRMVPACAGTTIESHCFTSANVDRQPNSRLARMRPFHTMARMRRDVQIVTGLERAHL